MPTYEYECGTCGTFEQFQRITEDPLADCPRCGSGVRRLISSGTGIIFKGSGFYSTDSRNAGKGKESSKGDPESSGKDGSGGESKTDSKTDSKTGAKSDTKSKKEPAAAATTAKD